MEVLRLSSAVHGHERHVPEKYAGATVVAIGTRCGVEDWTEAATTPAIAAVQRQLQGGSSTSEADSESAEIGCVV